MKFLCYGSLNIDYVYNVNQFVKAGETIPAYQFEKHSGGKGLNQAVALAKANGRYSNVENVYLAGKIAQDGVFLTKDLSYFGVKTDYINICGDNNIPTGHAIIQINSEGNNCIIVYGGVNISITEDEAKKVLSGFTRGDYIFLQNEINNIPYIIRKARENQMVIVMNPSPVTKELLECSELSMVDWFILNETEIYAFTEEKDPVRAMKKMYKKYPKSRIILTLGADGSRCYDGEDFVTCQAFHVDKTVDTTGAGDAYAGYFFNGIANKTSIFEAMKRASLAAGVTITRKGAAATIPCTDELSGFDMGIL
ncbi:MAG: ribokinase [Oscillospiraceae bacterium]|nr:ribokinase [Oscillospiraceae bacterium]